MTRSRVATRLPGHRRRPGGRLSYLRNQAAADAVVGKIVRAGGQATAVDAGVSVASKVVRLFEHTDKT